MRLISKYALRLFIWLAVSGLVGCNTDEPPPLASSSAAEPSFAPNAAPSLAPVTTPTPTPTPKNFSVSNDIPPRLQWAANNGYCGEVSFANAGLYYGQYLSQFDIRDIASQKKHKISQLPSSYWVATTPMPQRNYISTLSPGRLPINRARAHFSPGSNPM